MQLFFGPFALDSSCATLLAQINVAYRKLCNNLVFLSLEPSPNLLEIYDASTYKSCQFIALYLKKKKKKRKVTPISRYWRGCEPISMFFAYI